MFFFIGIAVLYAIVFWKIFTKAGEDGWKALIPIYNLIILLKITGKPLWWLIFFLIPIGISIINSMAKASAALSGDVYAPGALFLSLIIIGSICAFVFHMWLYNMISKSFGKDEGFTVGLVLLGFIFFPILAFGDARYIGPYGNKELLQRYQEGQQNSSFDFENDVYQGNKPGF